MRSWVTHRVLADADAEVVLFGLRPRRHRLLLALCARDPVPIGFRYAVRPVAEDEVAAPRDAQRRAEEGRERVRRKLRGRGVREEGCRRGVGGGGVLLRGLGRGGGRCRGGRRVECERGRAVRAVRVGLRDQERAICRRGRKGGVVLGLERRSLCGRCAAWPRTASPGWQAAADAGARGRDSLLLTRAGAAVELAPVEVPGDAPARAAARARRGGRGRALARRAQEARRGRACARISARRYGRSAAQARGGTAAC